MVRKLISFLVLASLAAISVTASPSHSVAAHRRVTGKAQVASKPVGGHSRTRGTPLGSKGRKHNSPARSLHSRSQPQSSGGHGNPQLRHAPPSVPARTAQPPTLRGRSRIALPLKGSAESLARQNQRVEAEGLERILDDDDLNDRIAQKLLVPVPASTSLVVNANLPENRRYCRPWTADFLKDLARAFAVRFKRPIEVSSAVRTVEYQKELMQTNGNAAAAEGDVVSPHLTGATIDIVKQGMSGQELGWMRSRLLPLQTGGSIDVEEEFRQSCFHITVYKTYVSPLTVPAETSRRHHLARHSQVSSRG